MMKSLYAIAVFSVAASTPVAAQSWSLSEMNKAIEQTNFLVNDSCSGTLIDLKNRYVLTANHCVEGLYETIEREDIADDGVVAKKKVRRLRDGSVTQLRFHGTESVVTVTYKVRLKAVDAPRDLALMQVLADLPNTQAASLACEAPVRGEPVFIVGNPMGALYSSVTTGIVSSVQRDYGLLRFGDNERAKQPLMQISGGVVGGNSGGAVYNARGILIGVPVLGHRVNEVLAFAVPLDSVKAFLKENGAASVYSHCAGD